MKMKPEYIRKLLISVESVNSPTPTLLTIAANFYQCEKKEAAGNIDDEFVLHYELLFDYGFIEPLGDHTGIQRMMSNDVSIADVPIRMTAHGHEFIAALEKEKVWEVIKNDLKEESLDTIFTISKELAVNFAKEKIGKYLS